MARKNAPKRLNSPTSGTGGTPRPNSNDSKPKPWSDGKWNFAGVVTTGLITGLIGMFLGCQNTSTLEHQLSESTDREKACRDRQPSYDATEELYRVLPSDCDYIIRNLVITKQLGSRVEAFGPRSNQSFAVTLSSMLPDTVGPNGRTNYIAKLNLEAVDGSNRITPRGSGQNIKMLKGQTISNISAIHYEFYLHVDSVDVDTFTLSLARRMNANSTIEGVTAQFGALQNTSDPTDIPTAIIPRRR